LVLGSFVLCTLVLVLNPVSRLAIQRSAFMLLPVLKVGLRVLLIAVPTLGIAIFVAGLRTIRVGRNRAKPRPAFVRRLAEDCCRAGLPLLLAANFLVALRLHDNLSAYLAGGLLITGTFVAFLPKKSPPGARSKLLLHRPGFRITALVLGLGFEALIVLEAVPWTRRGFYQGPIKHAYLRPLLQPLLSVNLSGTNLSGQGMSATGPRRKVRDFGGMRLEGARLVRITAQHMNFRFARLQTAVMTGSDLEGSDFEWADLTEAEFQYVRASGADFSRADLIAIRSIGCDLRDASFRHARLDFAKLIAADARGSDWSGADFRKEGEIFGSNCQGAIFKGANLPKAVLMKNDFTGADFEGACLQGASVWHTVFREANLEGADLRGVDAEVDQLGAAKTLFRAKLDPPLAEAIKKKYPRLLENPSPSALSRDKASSQK
jgi:uncharacterized protein YjbI with pentapeptide repeats